MAIPNSGVPLNDKNADIPDMPDGPAGVPNNGNVAGSADPAAGKNPPISEETRQAFAKEGIFQGPDGLFYKNSAPMKNPDGTPMTEADVKASLPGGKPGESAGPPAGKNAEDPAPPMNGGH